MTKTVRTAATIYSGGGTPFPPGSSLPLPDDHADALAMTGHVEIQPSANLPKVAKKQERPAPPPAKDD